MEVGQSQRGGEGRRKWKREGQGPLAEKGGLYLIFV